MADNLSTSKIEKFYENIIKEFSKHERLWGSKLDFKSSLENPIEIKKRKNSIEIELISSIRISFSPFLFKLCFCNTDSSVDLDKYEYYELKGAIGCKISEKDFEKNCYAFTTTELSEDKKGKLFIIDCEEIYEDEAGYFLYKNLKDRIKKDIFRLHLKEIYKFQELFIPIEYLLILQKNIKDEYKEFILYKLASVGLVNPSDKDIEIKEIKKISSITLEPESEQIICRKSSEENEHKAYKFYISAINNQNIFYKFLDLYHVIEYFFTRKQEEFIEKVKKNTEIAKHINLGLIEKEKTKIVLLLSLQSKREEIFEKFKKIKQDTLINAFQKCKKLPTIQTNTSKPPELFLPNLGSFIYGIRCVVTHRDAGEKHIEDILYKSEKRNAFISLNTFMFYLVDLIFEQYESKTI